jgi:glutamate racemase
VGGVSILRALRVRLPGEDFVYFGDTAWFPYGERSPSEVTARALAIAEWLGEQGAKLIVVACNTATAVALGSLERRSDVPVRGVVGPEALAAARASRNHRIGLLATPATIASGSYGTALRALDPVVELTSVACPGLATALQDGDPGSARVSALVRRFAAPLRAAGVDTAILGCTHYPAAEASFQEALPGVGLVTGGPELARDVRDVLLGAGLLRTRPGGGRCRFSCSGDPAGFRARCSSVLGAPPGSVERVEPGRPAAPRPS